VELPAEHQVFGKPKGYEFPAISKWHNVSGQLKHSTNNDNEKALILLTNFTILTSCKPKQ
jgi:hypothetical protein